MTAYLICYFIVILFYIEKRWLLMRNLATILPLKSKQSGKFQLFNAIDGRIEMLKNSWNSKNPFKMKNCTTFYEAQIASRLKEIILPPPTHPYQIKSYYVFKTKIFLRRYAGKYGHLLSKCFKNTFFGRQEMVQCKRFI